MASEKKATVQKVYQLKITLREIKPPIWRRVQVLGSTTLAELHGIIQAAMGWENYHLHQFTIGQTDYGADNEELVELRSEKGVKLEKAVGGEKGKFFYTYDFGDGWEHEIVVEKVLEREAEKAYPVCLKGKRACPPEDCGGAWGYEELLKALRDPSHEEHENLKEWTGGGVRSRRVQFRRSQPKVGRAEGMRRGIPVG